MKMRTRRLLSLPLALLLILTLAPAAFTTETAAVTGFSLSDDGLGQLAGTGSNYTLTLEPDASSAGGVRILSHLEPADDPNVRKMRVTWESDAPDVASVSEQLGDGTYGDGHIANIVGKTPGKANITATAGNWSCAIAVEVSGIKLSEELLAGLTLLENETHMLVRDKDYFLYGRAKDADTAISAVEVNGKSIVNIPDSTSKETLTVEGRQEGTGTVRMRLSGAGHTYEAEFPVAVNSNLQTIEWTGGCSPSDPLKFSALEDLIAQKCTEATEGALTSIVGLSASTAEGTLYLGYKSPDDTGAGVGGSMTYYARSGARGPYISDITFVPKSTFKGETATITFTGNASNGKSFKGRILVTLTDTESELVVTTNRDTPVKLESAIFSKTCQEQTGAPLDYVVFATPSAAQGVLYRDYQDEWNYASRVSANDSYAPKDIENITFVPAAGFVGDVRIGYAGYSVSGTKYNGELVIQVKQGLNDTISYNDNGNGVIRLKRSDFDAYCENATGKKISQISFTPPPSSQGVLFLDWNGSTGTAVTGGLAYLPALIDQMTFVSVDGFEGLVRIPFSGTSLSGEAFSAVAELHIQSTGTGKGDINYICAQGQSVKLAASDFVTLCQMLTGERLHYITFQNLPDFTQGALYHNRTSSGGMGTRVSAAAKYYNSATPYIMNLSFWATEQFSYTEIAFTGASVSGQTFTGILTISSGAAAGSGTAGVINYSTTGQNLVTFSAKDFDDACRQATNNTMAYLRFEMPGPGEGILYYDYRAGVNPTMLDSSTTLYTSGGVSIDKVSFMPARGFSGTVSIPFTGWAIDGREFHGTVQVSVQATGAIGGFAQYETHGEPVHFSAYAIQAASGGAPASLRLAGLPSDGQGKIYYGYSGPTQYSWEGNTVTAYTLNGDPSVSNLAFVPKAGFYGTVEIPYVATDASGAQSNGTIRISVTEPYGFSSFTDLDGFSAQTKSAVEYLSATGVVVGVGNGKYDPNASIRRRDFCVMLARAFQFNANSASQGFNDIPSGSYYAGAVNQMYALGVVNGVGGGRFDPNSPVTRQDAALMVQRALNLAGISVPDSGAALESYGDSGQVKGYAQGAVGGLARMGIFPVDSSGNLAPRESLTRADMALLLHRAMTQ